MPKAAIDEYGHFPLWQDYVGSSGQARAIQGIAETARVQVATHQEFGFCIAASNTRHHPAARRSFNYVNHSMQQLLCVQPEYERCG